MRITAGREGDIIQASFGSLTAAADLERRTITGTAVPYEVVGYTSWGPTIIAAGALDIPDRVVLLADHDSTRPLGLMASHDDGPTELKASFKVAATPAGDQVLLEAAEGIRNGLSVGVRIDAYEIDQENDWIRVTRGTLTETSSVVFPAFDGARVEKVAATLTAPTGDPATTTKGTTMDEDQVKAAIAAAITEAQLTAATPPAPAHIPPITVQDPFPYRPGVQASFFKDMLNAQHDQDARARFDQATTMMTAANDQAGVAEIIPEIYRPDLYVGQLPNERIVIDSFSKQTIDGPNVFRIPKWEAGVDLMSDHVENTNPSSGSIAFDEQLVTPVAKSGSYLASREMIEGSNPAVDAIIMNAIREEYALDTEAYAITTFLAGATAGTVVDISDGVTMQILARLVTFQANRKRGANVFLAGSTLFSELVQQKDTGGRPLNPLIGPSNAAGTVEVSNGNLAVAVAGLRTPYVPVLTGGLLGLKSDATTFESGLRMWRWEEKSGPAKIEFAAFGYIACAVTRAAGLLKFATQA